MQFDCKITVMTAQRLPRIDITNYISTATISGFDIDGILERIPGSRYRPNGFPATVIPLDGGIINVYDSGIVTSTRSNNEAKSKQLIHSFLKKLSDIKMKFRMESEPHVSMIFATVDYYGDMDLKRLRADPHYVKDVESFSSVLLSFEGDVHVRAYVGRITITSKSLESMIPTVLYLKRYVTRKKT